MPSIDRRQQLRGTLPALQVRGLNLYYGRSHALQGVDLTLQEGVLSLVGRNGMGKTSLCKAIMGLVPVSSGSITAFGEELVGRSTTDIARLGIGYVPQGRRLFAELTVSENIEIGLMARGRGRPTREAVLALFPVLRERLAQRAGTLSGGEQQMLAMVRALSLEPEVLLLDEPTEGLMPSMIVRIREAIAALKTRGVSTILVEQRVAAVLPVADRVVFLENGRVRQTVPVGELDADLALVERYVGVG